MHATLGSTTEQVGFRRCKRTREVKADEDGGKRRKGKREGERKILSSRDVMRFIMRNWERIIRQTITKSRRRTIC